MLKTGELCKNTFNKHATALTKEIALTKAGVPSA